jgi:ribonuclease P protein component
VKREQRLRSAADFARVRERAPRAWTHPLLVLYAAPNDLPHTRVGITVSRRVGKAVVRNRVRRRIREAARLLFPRLAKGYDLVFVARPRSAGADWSGVKMAVEQTLGRAALLPCCTGQGRQAHPPTPGGCAPWPPTSEQ